MVLCVHRCMCRSKPLRGDIINYIDYLFISDEDSINLNELVKGTKGWVVQHGPTWSWVMTDTLFVSIIYLEKSIYLMLMFEMVIHSYSCFLYRIIERRR